MRILQVHNSYRELGGEDIVVEQERVLLESAGHEVVVYRRTNWDVEESTPAERLALLEEMIWARDTRLEIKGILVREKPDLVHLHNTFMLTSPSVCAASKVLRLPVVQTLHNYRLLCPAATFFRQGRPCEECLGQSLWPGIQHGCYRQSKLATGAVALMLALNRKRGSWSEMVDRFIVLSQFARQKFVEAGFPPRQIAVKPNFVYPDPKERRDGGGHALFVGRLSPEKGVGTLLAAWKLLGAHIPLVLVGDGPLAGQLAAEATKRSPEDISMCGRLGRTETFQAMKRATFLILPSECYENFPVTVAEAFACGVPVICSRLGAMPEIVADGCTGFHFTPGNAEDLAQKVEWAWTHPEQMAEMGREARAEYEAKYTAERNYEMLMTIYEDACRDVAAALPVDAMRLVRS